MTACSECGHCPDCKTYDNECTCCPNHGGSFEDCGCQYCEDCDCHEPPDNWCLHGCNHCADCCNWTEGDEHDDDCCCSVTSRAGGEVVGAGDNDYLDTVFDDKPEITPEELVDQWGSCSGGVFRVMEGKGGERGENCPAGYNYAHTGQECKYGYRPDLIVVHHAHTAKDGTPWRADLLYYGWIDPTKMPTNARSDVVAISSAIHKACGR